MHSCIAHPARLFLAMALGGAVPLGAQRPLNLDFERSSVAFADQPWGWSLGWSAFAGGPAARFALDSTVRHSGQFSLRIAVADSITTSAPQQLVLQVPAGFARGRTLTLSAWLRASQLRGKGQLMLEAWGDRVVAAADTATLAASGDWSAHRLTVRVPTDSTIHSIVIMASLEGNGTAWFDHLTLRVDDQPIEVLPGNAPAPTDAEVAALRRVATPLRTVSPSNTDDRDLRAVDRIIAGARIVALGESTHGTREFFQAKHRLLEYLVRRHGYRLFAIEANQLSVERVNNYVQGGPGSAREVARAMFAVWNTEEVAAMIDWLREYNTTHRRDPVRFAGYAMQDHQAPIDSLRAFLRRVEPALEPRVDSLSREYRAQPTYATYQVPDTTRQRWAALADTLHDLVLARRDSWRRAATGPAGRTGVEWAMQWATLYRQAARFNVALHSPERDSLMAVNVEWLLERLAPGAKAVVWAHDVHVSHGGDPARSFNGGAQMGAYLRRTYGNGYRAFSLLTHGGEYTATRSFTDHTMMPVHAFDAPAGSVEEALHRLPPPGGAVGWIVDLRAARTAADLRWLGASRPIRHVGYAAYDYGFDLTASLPLEFDGILFVDHTSASRLLRRESR